MWSKNCHKPLQAFSGPCLLIVVAMEMDLMTCKPMLNCRPAKMKSPKGVVDEIGTVTDLA